MRFTIWTPLPESAPHAGVKALWRLGFALVDRGHTVTMWFGNTMPECDVLILPERTSPATTHPRTVRWVLLHGGTRRQGERVYTWARDYEPDAPILNVPVIDLEELAPDNRPSNGVAMWIGKGTAPRGLGAGYRQITYATPRAELVEILKTSTMLLSFDAHSTVNTEATLCGTPVHIPLPRPAGFTDDDDPGFMWADCDRTNRLADARPIAVRRNARAEETIDAFVEDMTSWK
jgi:hypothetical protein